jgi:diguanylate cyclase (GGDEF)-like protein
MIGLFLDDFYGEYGSRVWAGAAAAARKLGVTLVTFTDNSINEPSPADHDGKTLFSLASPRTLDALIVLPPSIADNASKRSFSNFLDTFSSLPTIRLGADEASSIRVIVENHGGMRALVDHLIERHGRSRIAFIRGPEGVSDAEARYDAYRASLETHRIPLIPSLVLPGDFQRSAGTAAAARLIETGERFDGLVGTNDYMALYAMKELQRRGIRVPDQVSVAGFDDFLAAKSSVPGLCTVHQPMEELGEEALRLAVSAIRGEASRDERRTLATHLVLRRSCGCLAGDAATTAAREAGEALVDDRTYAALRQAIRDDPEVKFRILLEDSVVAAYDRGTPVSAWQDLAFELAQGLPVDARWDAGRSMLRFLSALQEEIASRSLLAETEEESVFNQLSGRLLGSADTQAIKEVLSTEFASDRSAFFCLSLYRGEESAWVLCCTDKAREGAVFRPQDLVPGGSDFLPHRSDILAMPLYDQGLGLGFFVCAAEGRKPSFYEALREQLEGAFKGASLVARIREQNVTLELKVEERTRELTNALSKLEATNEKLERLSTVDDLTGLYNRRGFFELSSKQIDLAKRLESTILLIYFDLDSLKMINDRYGHAEGDSAIKAIARVLIESFRKTDIVARLGGDEFTVLAMNCTIEECNAMIKRAEVLLQTQNARYGKPYTLSFSYGAAPSLGQPPRSLAELMAEADDRLYEAKRAKKYSR